MELFSQTRALSLKKNDLKVRKSTKGMNQFMDTNTPLPQRRIGRASDYSAHIQEAMRYDRLRSAEYPLVMTIMDAVLQGYTEERWQAGQERTLKVLRQQSPEQTTTHNDTENRYEQTVSRLKDLSLWPW
ncbi:MAG TPA: hypothetical protein VGD98_07615 [Ktedonobacteraceae bacterium]